nr:M24 family metallopeptidase [Massilia terrae]
MALLRDVLEKTGASAIRLRGTDWFAWITAGGSNAVLLSQETGAAEVLVSREDACILTDDIEEKRLRAEEAPPGFSYHPTPWTELELRERYVFEIAGGLPVLSDRPANGELPLPPTLRQRRMVLGGGEIGRYRALGRAAAEAMSEALRQARPEWTEAELAAAGAQALVRRGLEPALVLAAGERRLPLYRHPPPSLERIGGRAMLRCCARRHGLHASLARCVSFGPAPAEQRELMAVEATGLAAVLPGSSLSAVYFALEQGYRHANRPDAIREHHQGGITGYASREIVATPVTATELETGMAFAFNPSFNGLTIEDTFILGPQGLENLTCDPAWPARDDHGRMRPLWLEAT